VSEKNSRHAWEGDEQRNSLKIRLSLFGLTLSLIFDDLHFVLSRRKCKSVHSVLRFLSLFLFFTFFFLLRDLVAGAILLVWPVKRRKRNDLTFAWFNFFHSILLFYGCCYFCCCCMALRVVLGRVNDSSESDSILLAFFAGEREDSNKKSMTRVSVFSQVI
jgi:hypothetical protein